MNRCVEFETGDTVWLSIPHKSKLQPRWEGGWSIAKVLGKVNLQIVHEDGRVRVVHLNRIQRR